MQVTDEMVEKAALSIRDEIERFSNPTHRHKTLTTQPSTRFGDPYMTPALNYLRRIASGPMTREQAVEAKRLFLQEASPALEALALELSSLAGFSPPILAPVYMRQALELAQHDTASKFITLIEDQF